MKHMMWRSEIHSKVLMQIAGEPQYGGSKSITERVMSKVIDFKIATGEQMSSFCKLMRYADVFMNEDAFCHVLGDLLQEIGQLYSCNEGKHRNEGVTMAANLIADYLARGADEYVTFNMEWDGMTKLNTKRVIITLIYSFLMGETNETLGMFWKESSEKATVQADDTLTNELKKKTPDEKKIYALDVPFRAVKFTFNDIVQSGKSTWKPVPGPHENKPFVGHRWRRIDEKTLKYQKGNDNSIVENTSRDMVVILKNEVADLLKAKNPNEDADAYLYTHDIVFCDPRQLGTAQPSLKTSTYVRFEYNKTSYIYQESTNFGLKGILTNKFGATAGDDSFVRSLVDKTVEMFDLLYNTPDYLNTVYNEMVIRLRCRRDTRDKVFGSGTLTRYMSNIGISQVANLCVMMVAKAKIPANLVSENFLGNVLYELGRRLKHPPLSQHMLSNFLQPQKIANQIFSIQLVHENINVLKKFTNTFVVKDCELEFCRPLTYAEHRQESQRSKAIQREERKKSGGMCTIL